MSAAEMPASASASVATRTTRLSTVSVSNFPNGVCAHPTMLAVMVALPVLFGSICNPSAAILHAGFSDFMARSHMAVMPAQLPDPIAAAGHTQQPPTPTTFVSAIHDPAAATPIPTASTNPATV